MVGKRTDLFSTRPSSERVYTMSWLTGIPKGNFTLSDAVMIFNAVARMMYNLEVPSTIRQ